MSETRTIVSPSIPRPDALVGEPVRPRPAAKPSLWLSAGTLWWREIRGYYRERSRVVGGLITPLVFWLLLGSGFGSSMVTSAGRDAGYLQFFFPGTIALVVLFTAIFSNISLIEDRREGFLLSVLVAPVSPMALVLGKVLGATTIGLMQGVLFLPLAPLVGLPLSWSRIPLAVGVLALMSLGLTAIGYFFAWWLDSVQGFHAVMNVVLMPMWLLSGAVFPLDGAAVWVRWVMAANPLSYGVRALQGILIPQAGASDGPTLAMCVGVMAAFGAAALAAAFFQTRRGFGVRF